MKPCPFCGKQPVVQKFEICTTVRCQCHGNCYTFAEDHDKAVELWNKRE